MLERKRFRFRALFFSAGGNDLLGSPLPSLLRNRAEVGSWRDVIVEFVLVGELGKIRAAYQQVLDRTQTTRPGCLIERLNDEVLAPLATGNPHFHHVDLRGTLHSMNDWDDEIHPKSGGFKEMAMVLKAALDRLSP